MDNSKIIIKNKARMGKGVYAAQDILKDEILDEFDGEVYDLDYSCWTDDLADHVVQFASNKFRHSTTAKFFNHSCEPNCGIKDLFKIVAMRDIKVGEELVWDYDMTENNKYWSMDCCCGAPSCRKFIGRHDNLPQVIRDKYKGYISDWLTKS